MSKIYFLLRCLKAEPATDLYAFVVLLLLKALLAFLATLLDVLAIVKSFFHKDNKYI